MNEVERHIESIKKLCSIHCVDKLYLFGSILGRDYNENSDVDFIVSFRDMELLSYSDNYFNFKFSLEDLLQRRIDLLEESAIRNPFFIQSVNDLKVLIYG